ncbi:hypothetical protein BJ742DRAFT_767099 [Cladochytrium replicatum]|nr:hypothetical protein BJ742DRAFT_767099 [Cladochytrium replicatum]
MNVAVDWHSTIPDTAAKVAPAGAVIVPKTSSAYQQSTYIDPSQQPQHQWAGYYYQVPITVCCNNRAYAAYGFGGGEYVQALGMLDIQPRKLSLQPHPLQLLLEKVATAARTALQAECCTLPVLILSITLPEVDWNPWKTGLAKDFMLPNDDIDRFIRTGLAKDVTSGGWDSDDMNQIQKLICAVPPINL